MNGEQGHLLGIVSDSSGVDEYSHRYLFLRDGYLFVVSTTTLQSRWTEDGTVLDASLRSFTFE